MSTHSMELKCQYQYTIVDSIDNATDIIDTSIWIALI